MRTRKTITLEEVSAHLREFLAESARLEETILITDTERPGKPPVQFELRVTQLTAPDAPRQTSRPSQMRSGFGRARGSIRFHEGWDAPIEDFDFRGDQDRWVVDDPFEADPEASSPETSSPETSSPEHPEPHDPKPT